MHLVQSSNIEAIGHDADSKILTVRFRNGSTYAYQNVESDIFLKILDAPSVGSAFHSLIKVNMDRHPYTRVQ